MTPSDVRLLIVASGLSNREVASALDTTDDRHRHNSRKFYNEGGKLGWKTTNP